LFVGMLTPAIRATFTSPVTGLVDQDACPD
jgi:hypothetical protein